MRRFAANPKAYLKNIPNFVAPEVRLGPCDVSKVVKGYRCTECSVDLESREVKQGACAKCGKEARRIEVCVRTSVVFGASCHPEKTADEPFECCGKTQRTASRVEDRAPVSYACGKCGAKAGPGEAVTHEEGCRVKTFGLKKVCSKSGTLPHAVPER